MVERTSKILSLEAAARLVRDGSTVAVGGLSYYGAPMSLLRALIRRGARGLTVLTAPVAGLQVDLLVAAGCVAKVISPYVALEEFGLAPNFRRAAEQGEIEVVECGEAFLAYALKAAAAGARFFPLPLPLAAGDCARVNPLYRVSTDPFSGAEVVCVPAIRPDWTLLHAQRADGYGNLLYSGSSYTDRLLARASRHVLATADEECAHAEVRRSPQAVTIPSAWVRGVVPLSGAAWPAGSSGRYDVDRKEIKRYLSACKSENARRDYLAEITSSAADEAAFLRRAAPPAVLPPPVVEPDLAAPPATAEIIATVIARSVGDGMFTGAGTGCWEVLAGLRLAQLTHAPNLTFTLGGSGAVNAALAYMPASLNSDEGLAACEAVVGLEDLFDLEMAGAFDILFASGLQIDAFGNLNLAGTFRDGRTAFRGPGTVGLEFAPRVSEIVAFFRQHAPQTFVERVDFVSGSGYGTGPGSRRRWGLEDSTGPRLVVSNLAVLDFCPATKRMRLQSVHPGVTVEQVKEKTGFALIVPEGVPLTARPSPRELELLRTVIDRGGLLRKLIP